MPKIPTPNIDSNPLLKAIRDALWDREQEEDNRALAGRALKKRQISAWIEYQENDGGTLWETEVGPLLDRLQDGMGDDLCCRCGEIAGGGDGWDGLCGNCADRAERSDQE